MSRTLNFPSVMVPVLSITAAFTLAMTSITVPPLKEKLTETLDELVGLSPDFISVTCTNKNDDLARLTV